ncbi:ferredoxin [Clostridium tarantellae]|uniref:Ferredoxin n=1 Tax=Clostridium tarantellae TaxID=39493 RepID=A0A6I1MFF7_9CLOT|nr:ferredoxin [Clostridium tarantellae]MPQ42216.1 ferredoxin [Clostridium tarantellae]
MKVLVSQDLCIACGLCEALCVEVFSMNSNGKAEAILNDIPKEYEKNIQDAAINCPVKAISIHIN